MKFVGLFNSTPQEATRKATALVGVSGYESRSSGCLDLLHDFKGRGYAWAFQEEPLTLSRPSNDQRFRDRGFQIDTLPRDSQESAERLMQQILTAPGGAPSSIVIDVSSMSRRWHAGIVRYLRLLELAEPLTVYFVYVPAVFAPPPSDVPPSEVAVPIRGFSGLAFPDRPVALLLGLGYEAERALGLRELLDPFLTVTMIPSSTDARYIEQVLASNREVLEAAQDDWRFRYALADPAGTFLTLESITSGLLNDFRVVATSLGPKLFGLLCLLAGSRRPELSVWWVSAGSQLVPRDVAADTDRAIVCRTEWEPA